MKKLISSAVILAANVTVASAQMWLGGNIGFNRNTTTDGDKERVLNAVSIAPTIGYDLNEKLALAAMISYSHVSTSYENYANNNSAAQNTYAIRPFLRYYFTECGKLRFFVDGGVGAAISHISGTDYETVDFSCHLSPGISYPVNDRISLVAGFGGLSYTRTLDSDHDTDFTASSFAFDLSTDLYFGFYLNL